MNLYDLNDYLTCANNPYSIIIDNMDLKEGLVFSTIFKDVISNEFNITNNVSPLYAYFQQEGTYYNFIPNGNKLENNIFYMLFLSVRKDMDTVNLSNDLLNKIKKVEPKSIKLSENEIKELFLNRVFFNSGNGLGFSLRGI